MIIVILPLTLPGSLGLIQLKRLLKSHCRHSSTLGNTMVPFTAAIVLQKPMKCCLTSFFFALKPLKLFSMSLSFCTRSSLPQVVSKSQCSRFCFVWLEVQSLWRDESPSSKSTCQAWPNLDGWRTWEVSYVGGWR